MKINHIEKFLVSLLLLLYFLIGYRIIAVMPKYTSIDASTFLDNLIPLMPSFIVFYFLGYFFVFIPVFLIKDKKEFYLLATKIFLI